MRRFFAQVIFNFLTLNDDAHLKNFSLIRIDDEYRLSPAYDLINTSLHLSQPRLFALDKGLFKEGMLTSDVSGIGRRDFVEFGRRLGLPENVVRKVLSSMSEVKPRAHELIANFFLSDEQKRQYLMSYEYRRKMLTFKL